MDLNLHVEAPLAEAASPTPAFPRSQREKSKMLHKTGFLLKFKIWSGKRDSRVEAQQDPGNDSKLQSSGGVNLSGIPSSSSKETGHIPMPLRLRIKSTPKVPNSPSSTSGSSPFSENSSQEFWQTPWFTPEDVKPNTLQRRNAVYGRQINPGRFYKLRSKDPSEDDASARSSKSLANRKARATREVQNLSKESWIQFPSDESFNYRASSSGTDGSSSNILTPSEASSSFVAVSEPQVSPISAESSTRPQYVFSSRQLSPLSDANPALELAAGLKSCNDRQSPVKKLILGREVPEHDPLISPALSEEDISEELTESQEIWRRDECEVARSYMKRYNSLDNTRPAGSNLLPHERTNYCAAQAQFKAKKAQEEADRKLCQQIEEEEQRTAQQQSKTKTCMICTDELHVLEFDVKPPTTTCDHLVETCHKCLQQWVTSQFAENEEYIRCPQCPAQFEWDDMQRAADSQLFEKYALSQTLSLLLSAPEYKPCPSPTCSSGQFHTGGPHFVCAACKHSYCLQHKMPWHEGETCDQREKRLKQDRTANARRKREAEEAEETRKLMERTVKRCPGKKKNGQLCGWGIEKNEGCDHMRSVLLVVSCGL
ncbi:MAG: hypothetical protein M1820_003099 [Bogoriella megaspora]|nr:MAG: hypothetical protein M1820_003099 [Bogoriella megaspora]